MAEDSKSLVPPQNLPSSAIDVSVDPEKFLDFFKKFKDIENRDTIQYLENVENENKRQFDFAKAKLESDERLAGKQFDQEQQQISHVHKTESKIINWTIAGVIIVVVIGAALLFTGHSKEAGLFFTHIITLVGGISGGYGYARSRPKKTQ